jgi:hypothetical protein
VEIEKRRERLRKRIDTWRSIQKTLVPQIGDLVAQQAISGKTAGLPEKEALYVPSDFGEGDRIRYDLVTLGENQRRLLQGTACDYVAKIKTVSKTIDSGKADKKLQEYAQRGHTRAGEQIRNIEKIRQRCIDDYSATRDAMIALGMSPEDPSYPPLTLKDTFRKATHSKRAIGDSRQFDGLAWTRTGVTGGSRQFPSTATNPLSALPSPAIGTQAVKAKRKKKTSFLRHPFAEVSQGTPSTDLETRSKGKKRRVEEPSSLIMNDGEDEPKGVYLRCMSLRTGF